MYMRIHIYAHMFILTVHMRLHMFVSMHVYLHMYIHTDVLISKTIYMYICIHITYVKLLSFELLSKKLKVKRRKTMHTRTVLVVINSVTTETRLIVVFMVTIIMTITTAVCAQIHREREREITQAHRSGP